MRGRYIPVEVRAAAVADYYANEDTLAVVAARHGISRTSLADWVKSGSEVAYEGGWERRGGVLYPLAPERRSA